MSVLQKVAAAALVALLAAVGYGLWTTSPTATSARAQRAAARASDASDLPVIDQNMYVTAKHLARFATTAEEQPLAQSAVQIADHELDLAFTAAIHHLEAHPPVLSAEALQIQQRLLAAQKELESDAQEVKRLTAALARAAPRAPGRGSAAVTAPAATPAPAAPAVKASAIPGATAGAAARAADAPTLLNTPRKIAAEQHRLTLRDQRIAARRRLADI